MVSPTAEAAVGGGLQKSSSTKPSQVQQLASKARVAQAAFEAFSQEQVDAIVREFGKYVYGHRQLDRLWSRQGTRRPVTRTPMPERPRR